MISIKNLNIKQLILLSIIITISIFNIFTLFFSIVNIEASALGTHIESNVNGFSVINEYPAVIEKCGTWLGFYSIIHILITVIILVMILVCLFKKEWYQFLDVGVVTNIISCLLSFVYMINGIVAVSEVEADGTYSSFYKTSSVSFLPFILTVLLTVTFFVVKTFMEDNFSFNKRTATAATHTASVNVADELLKYKNLLDQGAITEEEYEKKKNQLLNT